MSLQNTLNQQAINKLTTVANLISNANKESANTMRNIVLREMLNSRIAIDFMTSDNLKSFENSLIEIFKFNELI